MIFYICWILNILKMGRRIFLAFILSMFLMKLSGQTSTKTQYTPTGAESNNVIQTVVPFLTIAPDSRGGAMGDAGVATSPDINSLHWNASKYAFIEDNIGISISYSPWLKAITNDIKLLYLSGFYRLDKTQVVAGGIRFFNLGQIVFTDQDANPTGSKVPTEFTLEGSYSRLFTDRFSGGITFKFVRSDLASGAQVYDGGPPAKVGISFAADISAYYHKPLQMGGTSGEWALGMNISNIGTKMSYADDQPKLFIPTNMKIGGSITTNLDAYNKFTFSTDFNKLLVPTPPIYAVDSTGKNIIVDDKKVIAKGMNPDVSVAQGIFQSFYDAPGGFSEEMKEISLSIGGEYWYREQFAVRVGYFDETAMKGNRKYFTVGFGIKMNVLTLDFSYLLPAASRTSPLANTMRFSASFNIGRPKKQLNKK
jgi:hypothetical protein